MRPCYSKFSGLTSSSYCSPPNHHCLFALTIGLASCSRKRVTCSEHSHSCLKIESCAHAAPYEKASVCNLTLQETTTTRLGYFLIEAATHILGSHQAAWEAMHPKLVELGLASLFDRNHNEFVATLRMAEHALLSHNLPPVQGLWCTVMASASLRNWLALEINQGRGSGLAQDYAHTYRALTTMLLDRVSSV